MAENIVAGLFGLDPNDIRERRMQQGEVAAQNFAQLDPFQRANYMMFKGGQGLGNAGAGMFGLVDPRIESENNKNAIASQIDWSNPEAIMQGAALYNQAGMPREAALAVQYAQEMQARKSKLELDTAHAEHWKKGGAKGTVAKNMMAQLPQRQATIRIAALNAGRQGGLSGNDLERYVNEQVRLGTETWVNTVRNIVNSQEPVTDAEGNPIAEQTVDASSYLPELNPEIAPLKSKAEVAGEVAAATEGEKFTESVDSTGKAVLIKNKNAIGNTPAQYSPTVKAGMEGAATSGKASSERNSLAYTQAKSSRDNLYKINELINHLNTSDATTGLGADIINGFNRARALLGGKDAIKDASDTEILNVMMGADVFPLIQSLGIGARGMDTPAEREFMRSVLTGSINLNKETLLKMANSRKGIAENNITEFNKRINKGELDGFFEQSGITKEPILIPAVGKWDLSTPAKRKEVQDFISELRKTDPREADKLLNEFKAQLKEPKKPKLTKEQAKQLLKERGVSYGE